MVENEVVFSKFYLPWLLNYECRKSSLVERFQRLYFESSMPLTVFSPTGASLTFL